MGLSFRTRMCFITRPAATVPTSAFLDVCPCGVRRKASMSAYGPFFYHLSNFLNRKAHSAVASLLRDYGFSDAQISSLQTRANIFSLNAEKNLLPKFEFFASIGLSNGDIRKIIVRRSRIVTWSLQNHLIPICDFLRDVPLDDKQITRIIKRYPGILMFKEKTVLTPNLNWLRENGVTQSSIRTMMLQYTSALCWNQEKFRAFFNRTVQSGLCPSGYSFISAMHVISCLSKDKWESKVSVFKSFGLTDDDVALLFQKQPRVMGLSEKNIARTLEFFIVKHSFPPAVLAQSPVILTYSFERRIIPRCLVMDKLVEEGLTRKFLPNSFLVLSEEKFLNKFIHKYKEVIPELLELYDNAMPSSSKTDA